MQKPQQSHFHVHIDGGLGGQKVRNPLLPKEKTVQDIISEDPDKIAELLIDYDRISDSDKPKLRPGVRVRYAIMDKKNVEGHALFRFGGRILSVDPEKMVLAAGTGKTWEVYFSTVRAIWIYNRDKAEANKRQKLVSPARLFTDSALQALSYNEKKDLCKRLTTLIRMEEKSVWGPKTAAAVPPPAPSKHRKDTADPDDD